MDFPYTPSVFDEAVTTYLAGHGAWYLTGTPQGRATLARHSKWVGTAGRSFASWGWQSGGRTAATFGAKAAGAVAAGYVIGATVGTGLAYVIDGDRGVDNAIDLYTGKVSWAQYWDTVGKAF